MPVPALSVFIAVANTLISSLANTNPVSDGNKPLMPDLVQKLYTAFSVDFPQSLDGTPAQLTTLVQNILKNLPTIKSRLGLPADNVFDASTIKKIIDAKCNFGGTQGVAATDDANKSVALSHNTTTESADQAGEVIAYKIHSSIPTTVGQKSTVGLVRSAANNWNTNVASLLILRSEDANGYCNVTIMDSNLGPGVLGKSPVAGPGNLGGDMLLNVNMSEIGDDFKTFLETVTHEFGHIAGLEHNFANSQAIMHPTVPPGVVDPAQDDIDAIQAIWGVPPV